MGSLRVAVVLCAAMILCRMGMEVSAQQATCSAVLLSLEPCLQFISGSGSGSIPQPGSSCCTALQAVDSSNFICLCQLLGYDNSSLTGFNATAAQELPAACNVNASASQCPGYLAPVGSPVAGPIPAPSSGGGSEGNPAPTLLPSIKLCLQLAAIAVVAPLYLFVS